MKRHYLWPAGIACILGLACLSLTGDGRLCGQNAQTLSTDTPETFTFELALDAEGIVGEFTECYGLGSSNRIEEEAVVDDDGLLVIHKTPGALEWNNIILKRPGPRDPDDPHDSDLQGWRRYLELGRLENAIQDGSLRIYPSGSSQPLVVWNFVNGWVASRTLEGDKEVLVIVHDGLSRDKPHKDNR